MTDPDTYDQLRDALRTISQLDISDPGAARKAQLEALSALIPVVVTDPSESLTGPAFEMVTARGLGNGVLTSFEVPAQGRFYVENQEVSRQEFEAHMLSEAAAVLRPLAPYLETSGWEVRLTAHRDQDGTWLGLDLRCVVQAAPEADRTYSVYPPAPNTPEPTP